MKMSDVARVLYEIVVSQGQWGSLIYHYAKAILGDPLKSLHEDWDDCWDVAYNNSLDWQTIVELVMFWYLEEKMRLGAYETK